MDILGALISIFILVYSSILHEIAHGYVAYRLGDPTAKLMGRLTLNPKSHIDPFMTIILPILTYFGGVIIGGAKPVPVDTFNLRDGIKDLALVSIAGPGTNILLAIIGSILIHLIFPGSGFNEVFAGGFLGFILATIVRINLILAIFNLVPIPPLDGSKIFAMILPRQEAAAFLAIGQRFGMFILIFLLYFPIGGFSLIGFVGALINYSLRLLGL
ncbi:MAG TPA: site-2 protease family protein [Candidatus Saccharimonadales bacterium]|nr:site-2 protease family protein [Candidatus Saccharimonadales bacterium]